MAERIDVRVFGPAHAVVDGVRVDVGGQRPRSLLAALAAAGAAGVTTDRLIDVVWGDDAPATARKSVQKYVSAIRSALGEEVVQTTPTGYALDSSVVSVDLDRFVELVEEAGESRSRGELVEALALLDRAFAVAKHGAPLQDLDGALPYVPERAAVGERLAVAREQRIDALLALGHDTEAITAAERMVGAEPLREKPWGQLMLGLYRAGRQSDALRAFRSIQRLLSDELGLEPSRELVALEQRILLQSPDLDLSSVATDTLPVSYTTFVGRSQELDELASLMAANRLLTITGPGGAGKTRLAVERARVDAVSAWFADLGQIDDAGQLVSQVATAMGLLVDANEDAAALARAAEQRAGLLVLDNCEHVLGEAAGVAHHLLTSVRTLRILATSRRPLGLTGEVVYSLGPLDVPPTGAGVAEAMDYPAVQLFVERARAADPAFTLDDASVGDAVSICRRLEGMPLGIELAARRLGTFGLADLRSRLVERLDLLTAPGEPVARHRTLDAAIDWSYRLLPTDVGQFFAALSVFPGDFSIQAAARLWQLLGGSGTPDAHLAHLVESSMIERITTYGDPRFRLLEPIRSFGRARASDVFRPGELGEAHAGWVLELLSEYPAIIGPGERDVLQRLRAEEHHFPVALAWATKHDPTSALRLMIAATGYLWMATYRFAWASEIKAAMATAVDVDPQLRAAALAHAGHSLAENFADHDTAAAYAEEALEYATAHNDRGLEVVALVTLANATRNIGHLEEAAALYGRAVAIADEHGEPLWAIQARRWLAFTEMQRGRYDEALRLVSDAGALGDQIGSDWVTAKSLWLEAAVLALNGEYRAAERSAAAAFDLFEGFADDASPIHVRAVQGDAARLSGDPASALPIYEECLRGFVAVGDQRCAASTLRNLGATNLDLGNAEAANHHLLAALQRRAAFGDEAGMAECFEGLGRAAMAMGSPARAVALLAAAANLRSRTGSQPPRPEKAAVDDAVATARLAAGPGAGRAWQRGRGLGLAPDPVAAVERLGRSLAGASQTK